MFVYNLYSFCYVINDVILWLRGFPVVNWDIFAVNYHILPIFTAKTCAGLQEIAHLKVKLRFTIILPNVLAVAVRTFPSTQFEPERWQDDYPYARSRIRQTNQLKSAVNPVMCRVSFLTT